MNSDSPGQGFAARRPLRRALTWAAGLTILAIFVYVLYRERHTLIHVAAIGYENLAWMTIFTTLSILLTGLTTRVYLRAFEVQLSTTEAFLLAAASFLCGYLPMQLNLVVRAKYLKHLHSLNYTTYLGMVVVNLVVMIQAIGIYGLLAVCFIGWRRQSMNASLLCAFAICVFAGYLANRLIRGMGRHWTDDQSRWARLLQGARVLFDAKGCIPSATGISVCALLIYSLRFYCASYQLEGSERLGLAAVLSPVATLSMYVAMTPSGLGVREFISGGMSQLFGMPPAVGFSIAAVERASSMIAIVCWGLIGMVTLTGRMSDEAHSRRNVKAR